jgi:hypothetical protein
MQKSTDKLESMFELREEFMQLLCEKFEGYYPEWPIDLSTKQSQTLVRDVTLRGVEEMFEALQELKNAKPHRQTDVPHLDREAFLEEIVDAMKYFLTTLKLVGVTPEELHAAYVKKHNKICDRLSNGY